MVGHGQWQGLGFSIELPDGRLTSFDLAGMRPPPHVLVASCWSGRRSSTPLPLGLATACLLNGATSVVAGLWDLPVDPTVGIVLRTAQAVAAGSASTSAALAAEQAAAARSHPVRWAGLAHFGRA